MNFLRRLILAHDYIDQRNLANLDKYKYHGADLSLLANHVFQPFWRAAVELLPRWLAPNLITLIGTFGMVVGYCVVYAHIPDLQLRPDEPEPPAWVWVFASFCIFMYQTLDALDGKQARRTGSSSPLGELFDHGCDALSTALLALMTAAAVQYTPFQNCVSIIVAMGSFYLGQWEEYHTGTLYLGYINVTEALVGVELLLLASAWLGPHAMRAAGVNDLVFATVLVGALYSDAIYVWQTLRACRPELRLHALQLLLPAAVLLGGAAWWAAHSSIDVAQHYEYVYANVVGLLGSAIVGRLVLARIVCESVSAWQPALLPFVLVVANDTLLATPVVDPLYAAYGLVIWCLASYLHFALYVIVIFCDYLNISCLTLPPIKDDDGADDESSVSSRHVDTPAPARTRTTRRRSKSPAAEPKRRRSVTPTRQRKSTTTKKSNAANGAANDVRRSARKRQVPGRFRDE